MNVQQWFENGCDYNSGIELYSKIGGNKNLIQSFQRKKSHYNIEKLKSELAKFRNLKKEKFKDAPLIQNEINHPVINEYKSKPIAYYPLVLHSVYQRRIETFLRASSLKLQLNNLEEDDVSDALRIQFEIFTLFEENAKCWEILNHYENTKRIMPTECEKDYSNYTPQQLVNERQRLYVNASKRKNTIEKLTPTNSKQQSKLALKKEELAAINLQIEKLNKLINE